MFSEETEKQKELFGEFQEPEKKIKFFKNNNRFLLNRIFVLQFSAEKLTFLLIGTVLLIVLIFCLGAEQGKRAASGGRITASRTAAVLQKETKTPETAQAKTPAAKKTGLTIYSASPAPRSGGIHTIRIATYKNKTSAEKIAAKIKKEGFPAYFVKSGNFFLICVGDYNTRQDAEATLSALKKNYQDCYIKTTKKK